MKHISIIVTGPPAAGKSTIAEVIVEALQDKGFIVALSDKEPSEQDQVLREKSLLKHELNIVVKTSRLCRHTDERAG